jgi:predicted permease
MMRDQLTLRVLVGRFFGLFSKRRCEQELDAELHGHLDLLTEENVRRGMSANEARCAARREFGGIEQTKQRYREQRTLPWLDTLLQDLRFAARLLTRKPAFTLIAVATLAVGIGANTAIFSVVHSVLLNALPYPQSDRLTVVWSTFNNEGRAPSSGPELVYLHQHSRLFEDFAGIWAQSGALTGEGEPQYLRLGLVTSNFLSMLADKPQLGRFFLPEEQGTGAPKSIILSDSLWRHRFGANPRLVGQSVRLNGIPVTVVGILPRNFRTIFPEGSSVPPDMDAFVPFATNLAQDPPDQSYLRVLGRTRPGITVPRAQAELDSLALQLRAIYPPFAEQTLGLQAIPLHSDVVRNVRTSLITLFCGVGLVLLIACANVANLLLARANERHREITLRVAMGADRGRVIRQLLTESILLSVIGGAIGLLLGSWSTSLLLALRPPGMDATEGASPQLPVFAFTFALSLVSGALFGLAPALGISTPNIIESLRKAGRTVVAGRSRPKSILIAAEVALSFLLLAGAGLMLRTLVSLLHVNPGFDAAHATTVRLSVSGVKYQSLESRINFFRELQNKLQSTSGIDSVGVISHLPFDDTLPNWYSYFWPDGAPKSDQNIVMADHYSIFPGYFRSVGAQFVAGRDFEPVDLQQDRPFCVVDQDLAASTWPGSGAVGKKLNVEDGNFGRDNSRLSVEVIGVVKHIQAHSLVNPVRGQIYLLYPRAVRAHMALTIRSNIDRQSVIQMVRREVASLDKDMPVYGTLAMSDFLEKARRPARFITNLSAILAGIALLLACTGIYGVASYSVQQRTGEIGVRMALGARRSEILRMIARQSMLPVFAGTAVGLLLSFALTPLLGSLLFGVRPGDLLTLTSCVALLLAVGFFACYRPARRATSIDPTIALRYE